MHGGRVYCCICGQKDVKASRHAARGHDTVKREGRMTNINCIELLLVLTTRLMWGASHEAEPLSRDRHQELPPPSGTYQKSTTYVLDTTKKRRSLLVVQGLYFALCITGRNAESSGNEIAPQDCFKYERHEEMGMGKFNKMPLQEAVVKRYHMDGLLPCGASLMRKTTPSQTPSTWLCH